MSGAVPEIGELKVCAKYPFRVFCDRLSVNDAGIIYYVGIIAPGSLAKAFGAALNGKTRVHLEATDLTLLGGPNGKTRPAYATGYLWADEDRYRRSMVRLGFDWIHAAWTAKDPNFLPSVDPESLWVALRRPEFTTPMLREWLPYVTAELTRLGGLKYLYGFGARCGKLQTSTDQLDRIVTDGLRSGRLVIPGERDNQRREAV